jgi:enoyl-CoA hydratase
LNNVINSSQDLSVFGEMQSFLNLETCEGRKREAMIRMIRYLQESINAPEQCCVPVIAAISGYCIGGAVDLITACDMRYCTADAVFSIKETDLAMV